MRLKLLAAAVVTTAIATSWILVPGKASEDLSGALPAYSAQADYFLKIDGIEGESKDNKHKGEIEIQSFSWGVSQTAGRAAGGGGGAGKASFQDFHFTTSMSKASPKLMLGAASGEHFKDAVLVGRRAGDKQGAEFFKIKLSDILISSYQNSGNQTSVPGDTFTLNFAKIEFEYSQQNADGSQGAPVKAGWDVKENKKI